MNHQLDRTPDGRVQKCCECRREYKGDAWMDYCAECNAQNDRTSPLLKRWACLNCSATMEVGKMKLGRRAGGGFVCPHCGSDNTHPADGVVELTEYHGEIGTKN